MRTPITATFARSLTVLAMVATSVLGQASLVAAQCVVIVDENPHLCPKLWPDAIVFEATVDRIEGKRDAAGFLTVERLTHFRDIRPVRGEPSDLVASPIFGSEDCYYQFREGQRYLVVAGRRTDGRLTQSDLTRPIEESAGFLDYIQTLGQTVAGGQAWGTVLTPTNWAARDVSYGPVARARVTLRGPITRTIYTGPGGQYRFADLPWGKYEVRVDLSSESAYLKSVKSEKISLAPSDTCAEIPFIARRRTPLK